MLDIPGFPNYKLIEGSWEIFSINFKRTGVGKILKAPITKSGYKRLNLYSGNRAIGKCIHEIVALVFKGPKPIGYVINHMDGNKLNNSPDNLEYVTYSENLFHSINILGNKTYFQKHKMRCNLGKYGNNHSFSKKVIQFTKDGESIMKYDSTMCAERATGIYHSHIGKVCNGKQKTAGGFIWKYL